MLFSKVSLDNLEKSIVIDLLSIYSEQTKLPVALYRVDTQDFIWSDKYESPLCKYIDKISERKCFLDHVKRCEIASGKIELCHAGLWNIAFPIKIEGKIIGTLISGQRRLKEQSRSDESFLAFSEFSSNYDKATSNNLRSKYEDTPAVSLDEFDRHLLSNLKKYKNIFIILSLKKIQNEKVLKKKFKILDMNYCCRFSLSLLI